jgi:hypothetical protein
VRRIGGLVLALAVLSAATATTAGAALFFLFTPTSASPGELVSIRLGGTPAGFTAGQRQKLLRRPIRVYLVLEGVADDIRSRLDRRLHFVGTIVPDRRSRGVLTFPAPPLDSGTYVAGAWCPGCARYSAGRSFFASGLPEVSRFREQLAVRLELPRETCPVTKGTGPNESYGNGLLSTRVASIGTLIVQREADGTLFTKLGWLPHKGLRGTLTVSGERLDAPGRMRVLGVFWGSSSTGRSGWASPVEFPSEGCWRISGRVRDITLTYVVKVVSG